MEHSIWFTLWPTHGRSPEVQSFIRHASIYGSECWSRYQRDWTPPLHNGNKDIALDQRHGTLWPNSKWQHSWPLKHRSYHWKDVWIWYGHVFRADVACFAHIGYNLEVPGKRSKGRPKKRWTYTLHADLAAARLNPD